MPKAGIKKPYDLRKPFIAPNGNVYRSGGSLEAWIRFGSTVVDSEDLSGNVSYNNAYGASPTFNQRLVDGKKAYYAFDGNASSSIEWGDATHWAARIGPTGVSTEVTFSVWLKPTSPMTNTYARILNLGSSDVNFFRFKSGDSEYLGLWVDDTDSTSAKWQTTSPLPKNKWIHLAVSIDLGDLSSGPKMYVDGEPQSVLVDTAADNPFSGIATYGFLVGWATSSLFIQGEIAEPAVWSSVLSHEEINAVYNSSVTNMFKWSSGYLTNPVRTIIRENDYRTGSYPANVRTGDRDFSGKSTVGMFFDDSSAVDFTSPFPEASIEVLDNANFVDNNWLDLTSSDGSFAQRFEFIVSRLQHDSVGLSALKRYGGEPVALKPDPNGDLPNEVLAQKFDGFTSRGVAYSIAKSINLYSSSLRYRASVSNSTIKLKGNLARTGSYQQGNVISVGTESGREIPLRIKQFNISSNSEINYPTLLHAGSRYMNQNISSPNVAPDISTLSDSRRGIADYGIHFTPGENLSPFEDSRINLEDTPFYNAGTSPEVIEGFRSPLRSKTQVVFNLKSSNGLGTHLFYSTGSPGPLGTYHPEIAGKIGSGFSYWNDALSRWEMVNATADNQPRTSESGVRLNSVRGFSDPMYLGPGPQNGWDRAFSTSTSKEVDEKLARLKSVGSPVSTSGFPTGAQYNATGSQCIKMKDYISTPLLVEKIRVEIKANLGVSNSSLHEGVTRLSFKKFFILCQPTDGDKPHTSGRSIVTCNEYDNGRSLYFQRAVDRRGKRELISFGKICLGRDSTNYSRASTGKFQEFKDSCEKYIELNSDHVSGLGVTSSFSMDMQPVLGLGSDVISFWNTAESAGNFNYSHTYGNFAVDGNEGGADVLGNPSGRQIATSLDIADIDTSVTGSVTAGDFILQTRSEYKKVSPYLLFPEDNIVFGWENIPEVVAQNGESYAADRWVDRIKDVKVTFFGSQVRNNVEYHDTLNQPLTSEGLHEVVMGGPVVDKWDIEPISILSGSTADALFSGDMFSTTTGQRGRRASISAGEAGSTGSLGRNIAFFHKDVIYSDSRVPTIGSFFDALAPNEVGGDATDADGGVFPSILLSNRAGATSRLLRATNLFARSEIQKSFDKFTNVFPMRSSTGEVSPARKFPNLAIETTIPTQTATPTYSIFAGSVSNFLGVNSSNSPEVASPAITEPPNILDLSSVPSSVTSISPDTARAFTEDNIRALNSVFFAMPRFVPEMGGIYKFPVLDFGTRLLPQPRGYRYGFQNIFPTSPMYHFSRTSYGQFRDLLESPVEAKIAILGDTRRKLDLEVSDNNSLEEDQNSEVAPIKIIFVSRGGDAHISPLDTNTQNLSQFATSSEPFYDGESRERDIVNDPPPDLTDRTTIEEAVEQIIDGDA